MIQSNQKEAKISKFMGNNGNNEKNIQIDKIRPKTDIQIENHNTKESSRTVKAMKSFIAGGIAGVCSKTIIAPIQRVKYLFITSHRKFTYKQFFSDFYFIVQKHGVFNLWRGNFMNVLRIFPHAAIDFAVFDFLRGKFYKETYQYAKIRLFLCGAIAGLCSLTMTTPLQFLRVRMMMQRDNFSYKGNSNAMATIYRRQGFLGFYNGYIAAGCGIIIYHGCSFFIFTKIKQKIKHRSSESFTKWYVDFAVGALSAGGQLIAYPFDVLRKRMQGQMLLLQKGQISKKENYLQLIRSIWKNQNKLKGFYKGVSLNMFKAPLGSATVWTIKNFIHRRLDENYDL